MTSTTAEGATSLWTGGWYRFARRLDSPNFGQRPAGMQPDLLVIHSISLPPGDYGRGNVQRLFTNQLDWSEHPYYESIRGMQVSAHFFIERSGRLWQFVDCDARAWHAGESAWRGRSNCNDDSVGIELEGLEGGAFEAPQYETLLGLAAALVQRYPIAHVAGHEHIAPGRKHDPGAAFDWAVLKRGLSLSSQCFPLNT
ncbi:MAG: 1,6-anhydro-N-acetylmuramyl-L-alanine amidase AmpD [Pseudomonadota bacterium]